MPATKIARGTEILFTCEHGGNKIPAAYRELFLQHHKLLNSHRGYDEGALQLAKQLARTLNFPLIASTTSRLLIDLNRSAHNPRLYSSITRQAAPEAREKIIEQYYQPYRQEIEMAVQRAIARGNRIIHISCHTFAPTVDGKLRHADAGLLYDPARLSELRFCAKWRKALKGIAPELRIRRNYPYAGKADGFTTYLRRHFDDNVYLGIELEINQKLVQGDKKNWGRLRNIIAKSLKAAID